MEKMTINGKEEIDKTKIIYVITLHVTDCKGKTTSYLERITESLEFAKKVMQRLYDDATEGRRGKLSTLSDPEWLDERHTELKITVTTGNRFFNVKETNVYHLTNDMESNIFSPYSWSLY